MYPVLFKQGDVVITSFGVMTTLAFFAFILGIYYVSRRTKVDFEFFSKHLFGLVLSFALGTKLLYWILGFQNLFMDNIIPNAMQGRIYPIFKLLFNMDQFVLFGGVIGALMYLGWLCKKHRQPFLSWLDTFVPPFAFALTLGFLGAFLGGYYVGAETTSFLGVTYSGADIEYSIAAQNASFFSVHPIQLYAAASSLLVFFATFNMWRRVGQTAGLIGVIGTILLSLQTFIIEFFRSSFDSTFYLVGLSVNQWLSLAFMIFAIYLFMYKMQRIGTAKAS